MFLQLVNYFRILFPHVHYIQSTSTSTFTSTSPSTRSLRVEALLLLVQLYYTPYIRSVGKNIKKGEIINNFKLDIAIYISFNIHVLPARICQGTMAAELWCCAVHCEWNSLVYIELKCAWARFSRLLIVKYVRYKYSCSIV